jgi:hypothetical protein
MMMFRTVKTAITTLLGDQASGRFRVIGYQHQSSAQSEIKATDRWVQVYYDEGSFPRGAGRERGPKTHDLTISLDLKASAAAKGDLSVLTSETSTAIQKAAAIAAITEAGEVADTSIDELIEYVYLIMMDARNFDIGLTVGDIASRWIDAIKKDTLLERGDLVVKTANMKFTSRVQEDVPGAIGNRPDPVIFNSETPVDGGSSTGVTVENENT